MSIKERLRPSPQVMVERAVSPGSGSNIPVLERKKLFEQTELSRKGTRSTRSGSFRAKKLKPEESGSLIRNRQVTSTAMVRYRNISHYDVQSMKVTTLATASTAEMNAKKATGASAAHCETSSSGDSVGNDLVAACPAFRNEVGGDEFAPGGTLEKLRKSLSHDKKKRVGTRMNMVLDGGISDKDSQNVQGTSYQTTNLFQRQAGIYHPFEFIDYGACYYRNHFNERDHQNFFGSDEVIGPMAISLQREKVPDDLDDLYKVPHSNIQTTPKYQYRLIVRTSELMTLRGTVLEESIPSAAKAGTNKGLPPRDVLEYVCPGDVQLSCLKLGKQDKKTQQALLLIDEQELCNKYKIGVLYCKPGDSTEEDLYNNETGSPAFDEFLALLGQKVRMKGFTKYRAQLDHKADSTGEYSVYTEYRDTEVMFHVSTLLPFTPTNKQQLLRKRHIGNDIVTVIFQEPDCAPFSPKVIRSQFQHIFIVVRVESPNTPYTKYRVAIARTQDIPYFGPEIAEGGVYDKNELFKDFLLAKAINACNASLRSEKFSQMAKRTRRQYLLDLVQTSCTSLGLDQIGGAGIAGLMRGRGKKRDRVTQPLHLGPGAMVWNVSMILRNGMPLPFSEEYDFSLDCLLAISPDLLVILDAVTRELLLYVPTKDFTGWIHEKTRLNIFYDDCYCLSFESHDESEEDIREIAGRLHTLSPSLTSSHEATLVTFTRGDNGMLGFTINEVGVVVKVDGMAKNTGLTVNSRLLQVEDQLLCSTIHSHILELLTDKLKSSVKAFVVPPTPPNPRDLLYYPPLDWASLWSVRPAGITEDDQSKKSPNGLASPEPGQEYKKLEIANINSALDVQRDVRSRSPRSAERQPSDEEPLYDTLRPSNSKQLPLPKAYYNRVHNISRVTRESVVQFADDLMEKGIEHSVSASPEPVDHTIETYSSMVQMQVATSSNVPDSSKPLMAQPLVARKSRHDRAESEPSSFNSSTTAPVTPVHVSVLRERFAQPSSLSQRQSKTSVVSYSSPHSPVDKPAKMSGTTMVPSAGVLHANNKEEEPVLERKNSGGRGKAKLRPASWDSSLLFQGDESGDLKGQEDDMVFSGSRDPFTRDSNSRTPIRRNRIGSSRGDLTSQEPEDRELTFDKDEPPMSPTVVDSSHEPSASPKMDAKHRATAKQLVSVRERTKKWEERGGASVGSSTQSHLATLPRPPKKKSSTPATPTTTAQGTAGGSGSGIPVNVKSVSSLQQSAAKKAHPLVESSVSNAESSVPSGLQDQQQSAVKGAEETGGEETLLQRRDVSLPQIRTVGDASSSHSTSKSLSSSKLRGQSLLPTKAPIPHASQRSTSSIPQASQPSTPLDPERPGRSSISRPPGPRETEPLDDKGHQQGITPTNRLSASKLPPSRSSLPKLVPLHKDRTDESISHSRQQSGDSAHSSNYDDKIHLEHNVAADEALERHKKVEEWIQTVEGDTIQQDSLRSDVPPFASPTFTDGSLSFSGLSDGSHDHIETLVQRIAALQAKLDKEVENNAELKRKLSKLEHRLEEKEEASASERVAMV